MQIYAWAFVVVVVVVAVAVAVAADVVVVAKTFVFSETFFSVKNLILVRKKVFDEKNLEHIRNGFSK